MPVFSPHRRLRQDDLNSGFSYIVTLSQKKKKKERKRKNLPGSLSFRQQELQ
jgi:hypothetical protein